MPPFKNHLIFLFFGFCLHSCHSCYSWFKIRPERVALPFWSIVADANDAARLADHSRLGNPALTRSFPNAGCGIRSPRTNFIRWCCRIWFSTRSKRRGYHSDTGRWNAFLPRTGAFTEVSRSLFDRWPDFGQAVDSRVKRHGYFLGPSRRWKRQANSSGKNGS